MLKKFGIVLFCVGLAAVAAAEPQAPRQKQGKQKGAVATSLTGCVDEQNGQYVLINDRTTEVMADLEAVGFPQEGFAKHLGHKVTVKGTSAAKEGRPVIQVRTIEAVSDTCAPQQLER